MKHYEITDIQKLKFDNQDIWIKVAWRNTLHKSKPRNNNAIKKIIRINNKKRKNKYEVIWNDSWIELTQLTTSGKQWEGFYKNIVWKALCSKKYKINKGVICFAIN